MAEKKETARPEFLQHWLWHTENCFEISHRCIRVAADENNRAGKDTIHAKF
jgi:hypothetical protein